MFRNKTSNKLGWVGGPGVVLPQGTIHSVNCFLISLSSNPRGGGPPPHPWASRVASPPHPKSSPRPGASHPKSSPLQNRCGDCIRFCNEDCIFFFFTDKKTLCANERILCAAAGRVPMFVMTRGVTAAARLSAIAADGQSV